MTTVEVITGGDDDVLVAGGNVGAAAFAGVGLEDAHAEAVGTRVEAVEGLAVLAALAAHLLVDGSEFVASQRRGDVDARAFGAVEQPCDTRERKSLKAIGAPEPHRKKKIELELELVEVELTS